MSFKLFKIQNTAICLLLFCLCISLFGCLEYENQSINYVVINNNKPFFTEKEITDVSYEMYSELDGFGRCGIAMACIGLDLMPVEDRESIGQIKPSGWKLAKYDIVDGKYLYNRCHLIGFQLSGENANERNLITGTRHMNVEGMLPFENMVAEYVKNTGNHVMYRVTPVFNGDNLVAGGVLMEALSVEDNGRGIKFNVFVKNFQPGIIIDYSDGSSRLAESNENSSEIIDFNYSNLIDNDNQSQNNDENVNFQYVLNTNSKKIHLHNCSSVKDIKPENRKGYSGSIESLITEGYLPCKSCEP